MSSFAARRPVVPPRALLGPRLRAVLGVLGLLGGAVLLGLVGGRVAISHYGAALIALLIAIPVVFYLAPRPLVIAALLLSMMSVIGYGEIPRIPVPGHPPVNVADGLLALMVGGTLWRRRWQHWPRHGKRFALAILALLVLSALPTVRLLFQGHDAARQAILGYKDIVFLAVGITVAVECNGRMWRPLLDFAIVFGVLVALLSIAAGLSSGLAHVLDSLDAASVQQGGSATGGATRIRLPGLFFAYSMIFPTVALAIVVRDRWRLARALAVIPMLVAVAISFNRSMYFGLAAGLCVALVMGGPRLRHRAAAVAVTLALVIAIVVQTAILPAATAKVAQRATSALSTQVLQTSSLQDRSDEFAHALRTIRANPLYGVGWFQNYGSYQLDVSGVIPRLGVEDIYLHLATDLGIPVLLAFLYLVITVLRCGLERRSRTSPDPVARAMVAAGLGALVAMLISCLVGAYLQDVDTSLMFGLSCGLLVAASVRASAAPRAAAGSAAAAAAIASP